MWGINAVEAQGCGCISTFYHALLKIAVLLHKTANASHSFSGTVEIVLCITRKYPMRGYILGSGAPGTPGVTPTTYGTTFISDIL